MNRAHAGRALAVKRLNAALIDEIVRLHRCRSHRERDRRGADLIAERIVRLGGEPDYSSLRLALRGREPTRA